MMIKIYRSDTGQFVLVHDGTKTVIIDDELSRAYEKMQAYIEEHHPEAAALTASMPFEQSGRNPRDTSCVDSLRSLVLPRSSPFPLAWNSSLLARQSDR